MTVWTIFTAEVSGEQEVVRKLCIPTDHRNKNIKSNRQGRLNITLS